MMRMNMLPLGALAVGAMLLSASAALAAPIPVNNGSFEEAVLNMGGNTWTNALDVASGVTPDPDYWVVPGSVDPSSDGSAFVEFIDGFAAEGVNHIGMQGFTAGAGNNVVQTLTGVSLLPNTTYRLTVAVGNRDGFTAAGNDSSFGLDVGGFALGRTHVDASLIPAGTFEDYSFVYTTGDSPVSGDLLVSLGLLSTDRAHYDNVRLSTVIPEPTSLLLGLCGLAVGCTVRRRRNG